MMMRLLYYKLSVVSGESSTTFPTQFHRFHIQRKLACVHTINVYYDICAHCRRARLCVCTFAWKNLLIFC